MKKTAIVICGLMLALTLSSCAADGPPAQDGSSAETAEADIQTKKAKKTTKSDPEVKSDSVLYFGSPSGFYSKALELEIICADKKASVYYTTDGSEPDETDNLYTGPIKLKNVKSQPNVLSAVSGTSAGGDFIPQQNVDKANVIRAAAYLSDGTRSEVISGTYFVGVNIEKKYGGVPVISLLTDMDNLFDYEKGIYILGKTYDDWLAEDPANASLEAWQSKGNYSNRGREWERPVSVEYFGSDGNSAFVQDMGFRIMGDASRSATQKSLRLTAREEYGKKSVKYELIPDNLRSDGDGNVKKYKSFVIRNGGNDCDFAKVRDPYLQSLVHDRSFDTEQYTPCVVYLDGEYWGMYTLKEDYSDNYVENNYGIDNNNVVVLKKGEIEDGKDEDIALYSEMWDFITGNDMSNEKNYGKASEMLDMKSFADYCAFNLYIFNEDSIFSNNNWEMWRVREADGKTPYSDGKWRMMVYDTDYSAGIYNEGNNYSHDNISGVLPGGGGESYEGHPADIFRSLYKNTDFRRELVLAMCDIRNINFESSEARKALSEMSEIYSKLVPDTFRRFGPEWVAGQDTDAYFSQRISELETFIKGRYSSFPDIMRKSMNLGASSEMSLSVSDGKKGAVKINSSDIEINKDFKGIYFTDYSITLTAVPEKGKKFVRWECENCTVSDETSETATIQFEGDFSVNAVFK